VPQRCVLLLKVINKSFSALINLYVYRSRFNY